MGHPWLGEQAKLLRQYQEKGLDWLVIEVNKVSGAPKRTRQAIKRQASIRGYAHAKSETITTTPGIDAAIRRAYASGKFGAARRCADACNRPRWWIVARAKELGLRQLKTQHGKPWTDRERGVVRAAAHLPVGEIKARLKASGYRRTPAMILALMAREKIEATRDRPLSGSQVAELMGVDINTLTRHIGGGRLIAGRAGEVTPNGSAQYLIEPVELARFIIKHPQMIDLRKVDPVWFIDLLAHHAAEAQRDMHRNKCERIAQMVRENPEISSELVADLFGVSEVEARSLIADGRRLNMREAA
jgi:hypothetical protein